MKWFILSLLLQGRDIAQREYDSYFYSVRNIVSPIYVISKPGEPYEVIATFSDTSTANFTVMVRGLCDTYPDMQGLVFTNRNLREGEIIRFK